MSVERALKALKENDNLNLQNYKLHLKDFQMYSEDIFDPDENIFVDRKKQLYKERKPKNIELPGDTIPQDEIDMFQSFG